MALNEVQEMTKEDFYHNLRTVATEVSRYGIRWDEMAEFLERMDGTDLTNMGVPSNLTTLIVDYRTALQAVRDVIIANETTFDQFRKILVI